MAVTTLGELQEQIRNRYESLSKRLQQVSIYLIDNSHDVALDTLNITAQKANVPPSTLIRFASAFGFDGFNEMKLLFRNSLAEDTASYTDRARLFHEMNGTKEMSETPQEILQEFVRANTQAMQQLALRIEPEQLQKAVDLLQDAENIYIVGLRRSFSVAVYLAYAFSHLERNTFLIDGLGGMFNEQLNRLSARDTVISISFSPYAQETLNVSEAAAKSGARQIVITDSQLSPLASFSDVCFVVKEAQIDAFRSQSATQCLAQTLVVALAYQQSHRL